MNIDSYHIYDNYSHKPWKMYFVYTTHFLISPQYYSSSSGSMRFSFFENLNDYYHELYGIENSFYDHNHNHLLIHVHGFGSTLHSLQGMVQIQLDGTSDFSSRVYYFAQQQENMISI